MTREEADFIGGMNMCDEISNEAYKKIMCHCEEQEHCEDAISRQAVLSKIIEVCFSEEWVQFRVDNGSNGQRDFLINYIKQLAPVTSQSQPKIGRWIIIDDCEQFIAKCSVCGRIEDSRMISKYPYCHCGAKMQGVKKDEISG